MQSVQFGPKDNAVNRASKQMVEENTRTMKSSHF